MSIPDYQTLMLPLLKLSADGNEHGSAEAIATLADEFALGPDERIELLPSGTSTIFGSRVGWARTYMGKAGLLETTGRGRFRITERGVQALSSAPLRIDVKFLSKFPEFLEFHGNSKATPTPPTSDIVQAQTPQELLESSYAELRAALGQTLLDRVRACTSAFFEKLVVDLLIAMGYGGSRKDAGQAVGRSGDGGIDGIIKEG